MKKLVSVLLAAALLLGAAPCCVRAAPAGDVWDGETITAPTKLVQKDGVYYYEITTCAQLAYVAQTGGTWLSRNYLLANDLILNDVELNWDAEGNLTNAPVPEWDDEGNLVNAAKLLHPWTPIGGKRSFGFTGVFDGGGHTISGLYVERMKKPNDFDSVGLFGDADTVRNLHVRNAYLFDNHSYTGGVAARARLVENCSFDGLLKNGLSRQCSGGVVGSGTAKHCVNYGQILLFNDSSSGGAGGVAGSGTAEDCVNYGSVKGVHFTGGVLGSGSCTGCVNSGPVQGAENVGGVLGSGTVSDSCNTAAVIGTANTGGIAGKADQVTNCYTTGPVTCADAATGGAVLGSDDVLFGKAAVSGCCYLKTDTVNADLAGCGNVAGTGIPEPEGLSPRSAEELTQSSAFPDWDFTDTWVLHPAVNDGLPCPAWKAQEENPSLLTGLKPDAAALTLFVGDEASLTASQTPSTAALPALTWSSTDEGTATVDQTGRVTAVSPGSAIIRVSGGGCSAACAVTVAVRGAGEYRLGPLTVRDEGGAVLDTLTAGSLLVTVPVTKGEMGGDALVLLAAYTAAGQHRGLLYVALEDVPPGATVKVTFPVDNTGGDVAQLKAFTVADFGDFTPVSPASVFPAA